MKTVLIVGANSDIAKATVYEMAKKGVRLILAGRNQEELERTSNDLKVRFDNENEILLFDAAKPDLFEEFFTKSVETFGKIDGIIVFYGYLGEQKHAQTNQVEMKKILDINFTSVALLLNLYATYFERQKSGYICVLSSVAGDRGRQSNYFYGAAKGALTTYLEGLQNRLYHSNVHVLIIKPGFVKTKMTEGMLKDSFLVAKPKQVAKDIIKGIKKKKNSVYTIGLWEWIMLIVKFIPVSIFKRMKM